jgi:Fic family protein
MREPQTPPRIEDILDRPGREPGRLELIFQAIRDGSIAKGLRGRYLHWEEVRRRKPPSGLTVEEWWAGIRMARDLNLRVLPFTDGDGQPFRFGVPDRIAEALHDIDMRAAGRIAMDEEVTSPERRDRYIVSSLAEEAITSSQLEGASTTSRVARAMIRAGRKLTTRHERMILNNFRALEFVRSLRSERLTPDLIREIQRIVTQDTFDDPDDAGRLRTRDDDIAVLGPRGEVLHIPPRSGTLRSRLDRLCEFANGKTPPYFLHPVLRAILLHFGLAYDHPFPDGNGRTARALFYWSLLREDYWLFEYVSISHIVRRSAGRYGRAFLFTETDGNDVTYFLEFHIDAIMKAIDSLEAFLRKKVDETREVRETLRDSPLVNHRQTAIIAHGLRHPGHRYTIQSHRRSHNVTYQTARTDLLGLVDLGLMTKEKVKKTFLFGFVPKLKTALRKL